MKIRFEEKQDIPESNPCVVIQAKHYLIKHER